MTETAVKFVHIRQEFHGRGTRFYQLRIQVNTHLTRMNTIENVGVRLTQLARKHDQYSNNMGHSAGRLPEAQEDLHEMVKNLARQIEAIQSGTTPGVVHQEHAMADPGPAQSENAETESGPARPENAVSMVLDGEDLKTKTKRLIERGDHLTRAVDQFTLGTW